MSKREPGLDILRCTAFFFVVVFHSFLNNGYYYEPQQGTSMLFANSFRWLSVSCIGIFLMLTGYLKSEKTDIKACYRGLLPVLLGYLIAAAISIPIRHFLLGDEQTLLVWLCRLCSFSAVYYGWYVEMYIVLMLLIPFVNLLIKELKSDKMLILFAAVLLVITAVPGATSLDLAPDFWKNLYPMTYYVLGALVKRMRPKISPVLGIPAALLIAFSLGAVTLLSTDGNIYDAFTLEFADIWIVCIVFVLFISLYHVKCNKTITRMLTFAAGGCYCGYLLSHLLDAWVYRAFSTWHSPSSYWKLFACSTVPIYLLSLLTGRLLQLPLDCITGRKKK